MFAAKLPEGRATWMWRVQGGGKGEITPNARNVLPIQPLQSTRRCGVKKMRRVENATNRKSNFKLALISLALITTNLAAASADEDKKIVAALDTQYQAAVEKNDAETMARIHHDNMTLVLSNGTVQTGAFLEQRARDKTFTWEHQVEVDNSQVVRVSGDTAVVTAKLWLKATRVKGEPIDFKLWFSDTYVRTPTGWRYFFGQAGAPLTQ